MKTTAKSDGHAAIIKATGIKAALHNTCRAAFYHLSRPKNLGLILPQHYVFNQSLTSSNLLCDEDRVRTTIHYYPDNQPIVT